MKNAGSCVQKQAALVPSTLQTISTIARLTGRRDIPPEAVLAGSGIAVSDLQDTTMMVTQAQELIVAGNALNLTGDPTLGLQIGNALRVSSFGLLGYAMLVSPTLQDALQCLFDFPLLFGAYFDISLSVEGYGATLAVSNYQYRSDLEVLNTDMCLAALWAVVCDVMADKIAPDCVTLRHAKPEHAAAYRQTFGGPAYFGRTQSAVHFPAELLNMALPLADPFSYNVMRQQCQQLQRSWQNSNTLDVISRALRLMYSDPLVYNQLNNVAAELYMSERTLRRRLDEKGVKFQHLLDQVLRDKAVEYLSGSSLPVAEIAERLGYSETASFRHAFRRWTGRCPSDYRTAPATQRINPAIASWPELSPG
ncbi:AraC family transcriptional regulator [Amantichitinum ursilacus]|uniref:HTH-type transcriptional regulator VirS n=1 Tax=Amantichitinum ursilacus TaxID=857265 RepID=A0A0N0XHQ6_9NEIS|nr:AraC family transcriptional regulator [Amantichitinum ursilacus]KPC51964.1 HTH-type transcriptional regulator VirS [Amantichitinum ursilacus]